MALAAATGVSGGVAAHIPKILMPNLWDSVDSQLSNPTKVAPKVCEVEGTQCYHVNIKHKIVYDVYIGSDDFLIRRISFRILGIWSSIETHRDIVVNSLAPNDLVFKFKPPAKLP